MADEQWVYMKHPSLKTSPPVYVKKDAFDEVYSKLEPAWELATAEDVDPAKVALEEIKVKPEVSESKPDVAASREPSSAPGKVG